MSGSGSRSRKYSSSPSQDRVLVSEVDIHCIILRTVYTYYMCAIMPN